MHTPPLLLVVDDQPENVQLLHTRLTLHGYDILTATSGPEAIRLVKTRRPDLLLLDVLMPSMDGLTVCRQLKQDPSLPFVPIIMVTVKSAPEDVAAGLAAGADAYLTKPIQHVVLVAWIQALLRLKAQHEAALETQQQLTHQVTQLTTWSTHLEQQAEESMQQLERSGRLKPFVAPALAELVVGSSDAALLERHRRDVTVVQCTVHGFATVVATAPAEHVDALLHAYWQVIGPCIDAAEGTIALLAPDIVRVMFNAPLPCPEAATQAVQMALAMQDGLRVWLEQWARQYPELDVGIGIAQGDATVGLLPCGQQLTYMVTGPVIPLAARLSAVARRGEIRLDPQVAQAVHGLAALDVAPALEVPGSPQPLPTFCVRGWQGPATMPA